MTMQTKYPTEYRIEVRRVLALPGVEEVTVKHRNPYSGRWDVSFTADGLAFAAEVLESTWREEGR